jgi:branched-chain amino acid transport system substrate-binding protein
MLRKIIALIMALLMIILATGCGDSATNAPETSQPSSSQPVSESKGSESKGSESKDPILIGAVYPLTGSVAAIGQNIKKGIDFAVNEINSAGGVNGRQIEIVWGDSQGDPKVGMSEAERIITTSDICCMMGCYQSAVTEVVSQVAEKYQIPMVTAISTASALTTRGYKYFFRLCPTNMTFLKSMMYGARDIAEENNYEIKTVGVIADNTLMGQETLQWAKYWSEELGWDVIVEVLHPTGAADLTSEVLTIKNANPDLLVGDSYVADAILWTKTMKEQGYKPKIFVCKATGYIDPTFIPNAGAAANGIFTATEWAADMSKGAETNAAFKEEYDIDMNGHSAQAYTTVWVLKTAIENAAEIERAAIRDALESLKIEDNFPGGNEIILPYNTIEFTTVEIDGVTHTNGNQNALTTVAQIQDGKYVTVWPFDVTENKAIFPATYE